MSFFYFLLCTFIKLIIILVRGPQARTNGVFVPFSLQPSPGSHINIRSSPFTDAVKKPDVSPVMEKKRGGGKLSTISLYKWTGLKYQLSNVVFTTCDVLHYSTVMQNKGRRVFFLPSSPLLFKVFIRSIREMKQTGQQRRLC